MGTVKAIEKAVESLPPMEVAEFRQWFFGFDGTVWDRQFERDAGSGKLDGLAESIPGCAGKITAVYKPSRGPNGLETIHQR